LQRLTLSSNNMYASPIISKNPITGFHSLRYSFARHLLEVGYDIRTIQELMGYEDVFTNMVNTHDLIQSRA